MTPIQTEDVQDARKYKHDNLPRRRIQTPKKYYEYKTDRDYNLQFTLQPVPDYIGIVKQPDRCEKEKPMCNAYNKVW